MNAQWFSDLQWNASVWIGAALCLGVLEVLLGTSFFLLCLSGVCVGVGSIVYWIPDLNLEMQWFIFGLGSLASIMAWRHYLQKPSKKRGLHSSLNRRAEGYIGRTFALCEPIVNGRGKIRVDDSLWLVEGHDAPVGTRVEVTGVDGVILKVKVGSPL
jgi:membrane protein implicated in regulation of membrane protease activity